jgi:hypothetical protein
MLEWISKKHRDRKRSEAYEQELKKSLADKISKYEYINSEPKNDFTELVINGKKLRVAKEQITLTDPKAELESAE